MAKNKKNNFSYGEVFTNPYLGDKTTEVLNAKGRRIGWIWKHSDERIVVSPHIGFYVWFGEQGKPWTMETATKWLIDKAAF